MNKIEIIRELLNYVEDYNPDKSNTVLDVEKFKEWLVSKITLEKMVELEKDIDGKNFELFGAMQQYSNKYSRETFRDSDVRTIWDFSFLAILHHHGSKSMGELINLARMEKSSGMEVLKRIQQSKFVESIEDVDDKRKKLQKITSLGREKLLELYPKVNLLSAQINGDLTLKEKSLLYYLLDKLNTFHQDKLGY